MFLLKDYLVILAGSPRGGEDTWSSLYKYVVDYLDADLAICCSDKWDQDISLFNKAKYKWIFPEFENYFNYYDSNFNGTWKKYFETGLDTGLYTSGSVHFVFKDMILRNYLNILESYKFIIYTRFDQKYTDFHPKGKENKILIPEGEDYFGICDRHALLPSTFSKDFLNICNYVNSKESFNDIGDFNNCETTFKQHMVREKLIKYIERYNRSQFTASLHGEHTNWRIAKYKLYLFKNLMMKYPTEFIDSMTNLIRHKGILYVLSNELRLLINYYYLAFRKQLGKLKKFWLKRNTH
tara:strand:+ start:121 stop:1005 length:885 start_codon:yes stop_codon:yes gene_type:complete